LTSCRTAGGAKKISGKDYRPPTNEELQSIKETEQLFKSNVFRLQIEELLKEVKVSQPKLTKLEAALHHLRSLLEKLPAVEDKSVSSLSGSCSFTFSFVSFIMCHMLNLV